MEEPKQHEKIIPFADASLLEQEVLTTLGRSAALLGHTTGAPDGKWMKLTLTYKVEDHNRLNPQITVGKVDLEELPEGDPPHE